jgi:hypothetical protein
MSPDQTVAFFVGVFVGAGAVLFYLFIMRPFVASEEPPESAPYAEWEDAPEAIVTEPWKPITHRPRFMHPDSPAAEYERSRRARLETPTPGQKETL